MITRWTHRFNSPPILDNMTYLERKEARRQNYENNVKGWKLGVCYSCNGAGRYDSFRTPKCSGCNGTGKQRIKPEEPK